MKRILIIKLWAMGDILMATPLLRAVKEKYPHCRISWLVDTGYADILRENPLLDEVIAFDSGKWRKHFRYGQMVSYWRMSTRLRRELRQRRFDAVLNLTGEKWWSIWFLAAPVKVGLFPSEQPDRVRRLYTHFIPRAHNPKLHNSRHYLLPAEAIGIPGPYDERMVLGVSPSARQSMRAFLQSQENYDPRKPLMILHPGTSQDSKCWFPQNFASLAASLQDRFNIIITGSPSEQRLADAIAAALPAGAAPPIIAVGRLPDIRQTVALVDQASVVVTGDTSTLHIASALGTPLVGIYGSTRPSDNAPLFGPHVLLYDDTVPCAPCGKADCPLHGADFMRCQRAVTPEQALAAIDSLLNKYPKETYERSTSA